MDSVLQSLANDDPAALSEEAPEGYYILPPPSSLPELLRNRPSLTALAAYYGAVRCFSALLLRDKEDTNLDECGRDAIHFAASADRKKLVRKLCEEHGQQHNQDNMLRTALHYAVETSAFETVSVLIENEACVNAKDVEGITALHIAKDIRIAEILLNNDAKINARTIDGATPLCFAAKRGDFAMVEFLLTNNAKITLKSKNRWTPFHFAAQSGNLRTLKTLAKYSSETDSIDREGRTALHYSAEEGDPKSVLFFLKHGCDPNTADVEGLTPLHFAASQGNIVASRAIIGAGGNIEATDNIGRNCLHFAALSGSSTATEFFSRILSSGSGTIHGTLPIHLAAEYDQGEVVDLLASNGMFDQTNLYGKTPLAVAAEHGASSSIRALLKHGASLNVFDKSGMQPIDRAIFGRNEEITEILSDAGSTPSPMWSRCSSRSSSQRSSPISSPNVRSLSQASCNVFQNKFSFYVPIFS